MNDTACVRIYRIRDNVDLEQLISSITSHDNIYPYSPLPLHDDIQKKNEVEIKAFSRHRSTMPGWYRVIRNYIRDIEINAFIQHFSNNDFIGLISCKSKTAKTFIFAFCGGSGYHDIADFIDYTFGISVLESIFDPRLNKISSVSEKGIVGDILASQRFYRRARSLVYEDDFGKYYQNIITRFSSSQIQQSLPSIAAYKGDKLKPKISLSGSASIEIQININFLTLIRLLKDLSELMAIEPPSIFNKNLLPLDIRRDKDRISQLNEKVFDNLVDYSLGQGNTQLDVDFCHRDFDSFFSSAECQFVFHDITDKRGEDISPLIINDIYDISNLSFIDSLFKTIKESSEYKKANDIREFTKDALKSIIVVTTDDEGNSTTSGRLNNYLRFSEQTGRPFGVKQATVSEEIGHP